MRNCWAYAVERFCRNGGWLFVRFTKRGGNTSKFKSKLVGNALMGVGAFLLNWGAYVRTGKWMHVYHANSIQSTVVSYEPTKDVDLKVPPMSFKGRLTRKKSIV